MLTLALDTSGTNGSLALARPGVCLEERLLNLGVHHGQSLIPEVQRLLQRHALRPADVQLVAVSVGPGSFTGLRVGVVFAKTFAWATHCKVASVGTLAALAALVPAFDGTLHVISDAQRGDVFLQEFVRGSDGAWDPLAGVRILRATAWAAQLTSHIRVAGPGVERFGETIPAHARIEMPQTRCVAAAVAELGMSQALAGEFADVWTLEPLYLRRSSAEDKWDARKTTPDP